MANLDAKTDTPSVPEKRGFWGRFLFRGMLIGGIGLVFFLAFLIAVTVPNLQLEVSPPEISGPEQAERNRNASPSSTAPTSGTLSGTASDSTSGTQPILNLDDYPHLSPTMRKFTQVWLDQCEETRKVCEKISDPALRAQTLASLQKGWEKMRVLLNLPLKWDDQTFEETFRYLEGDNSLYDEFATPKAMDFETWEPFYKVFWEVRDAILKERDCYNFLGRRMAFEFFIHSRHWDYAELSCASADLDSYYHHPFYQAGMNSWEEELYCLRQMGAPGWASLAGRSYQRAFDSQWPTQAPNMYMFGLRFAGYLPSVLVEKRKQEKLSTRNPD
jgi:hypothetical protein